MSTRREKRVASAEAGRRLDRVLAAAFPDLTRSRLQKLILAGHVTVDGAPARASRAVRAGECLRVEVPDPEPTHLLPEAIPLEVVYDDDDLAVIDKPAGLVVHPGAGVQRGTLVHALLHRFPGVEGVGGVRRPGVVHRLDKDTSGLLVVAKTDRAYQALVRALAARTLKRVYQALVWGEPATAQGTLESRIGRHPKHRQRMAVLREGGRHASTHYRVEERFGVASRLRVELETGRTHQIRVHLAWIGHAVVGDPLYGGRGRNRLSGTEAERNLAAELLKRMGRQALHAAELNFDHPITGRLLRLSAPLPEDFATALELLRARTASRRR